MRKRIGNKYVKHSFSKHPKYYIVETKHNLYILNEYRKSVIAYEKTN